MKCSICDFKSTQRCQTFAWDGHCSSRHQARKLTFWRWLPWCRSQAYRLRPEQTPRKRNLTQYKSRYSILRCSWNSEWEILVPMRSLVDRCLNIPYALWVPPILRWKRAIDFQENTKMWALVSIRRLEEHIRGSKGFCDEALDQRPELVNERGWGAEPWVDPVKERVTSYWYGDTVKA